MTDVDQLFLLSLLQHGVDEDGLVVLYEVVDVEVPVVGEVGVAVGVDCATVVAHPDVVALMCEDVWQGFCSITINQTITYPNAGTNSWSNPTVHVG